MSDHNPILNDGVELPEEIQNMIALSKAWKIEENRLQAELFKLSLASQALAEMINSRLAALATPAEIPAEIPPG